MANPSHFSKSPIATINVGQKKAHYLVHVDVLKAHSDYFRACMSSSFAEGQHLTLELADVDPLVFGRIVDWLYGCSISEIEAFKYVTATPVFTAAVVDTYQLADRFIIPKLKNVIVSHFLMHYSKRVITPSPLLITQIRVRGLLYSQLGQAIVEMFARDLMLNHSKWQLPAISIIDDKENKDTLTCGEQFRLFCDDQEAAAAVMSCILVQRDHNWTHPYQRQGSEFKENEELENPLSTLKAGS